MRDHADKVAQRPANTHPTAELGDLRPGIALDAGCGHGSDALWLASRGWQARRSISPRLPWLTADRWPRPPARLFLVMHRPIDPATGAATAAADQVQVSTEAAVRALDPQRWEFIVAEDRPRAAAGTGVDGVMRARRLCF